MSSNASKNPHYSKTIHEIAKPLTDSDQTYHRFEVASKSLRNAFVLSRNQNEVVSDEPCLWYYTGVRIVLF